MPDFSRTVPTWWGLVNCWGALQGDREGGLALNASKCTWVSQTSYWILTPERKGPFQPPPLLGSRSQAGSSPTAGEREPAMTLPCSHSFLRGPQMGAPAVPSPVAHGVSTCQWHSNARPWPGFLRQAPYCRRNTWLQCNGKAPLVGRKGSCNQDSLGKDLEKTSKPDLAAFSSRMTLRRGESKEHLSHCQNQNACISACF